jgi:hypothetical protein
VGRNLEQTNLADDWAFGAEGHVPKKENTKNAFLDKRSAEYSFV